VHILLLNLYYPPDTSATAKMAASVAQALSAEHKVTVLCGRPSYEATERRPWRISQQEIAGSVRIIRVGSTAYSRVRMTRRLLNYLSYVALSVPRALFTPCDVVLAMTDPPFEGIVGAMVAKLKGKPYIYNIRDLYPDMALGGAIIAPGLLARAWEELHRWALRRAAKVIVLGEDMRDRIIAKGVAGDSIAIVRDGAEIHPAGTVPAPLDSDVIRAIRGDFRFVLEHAGNVGFYGAWDTLLTAARELADDGIALVFVGDGAQRAQVESAAAGLRNVRFMPFFPGSKIPSVLAAADVHVITVKRGLEGVVVPSKMYGILAAGRPIVSVAPDQSDSSKLGARQGFAISADPEKPKEVAVAIRALARDPEKLKAMAAAALAAAPGYDRVNELQKFVRVVSTIMNDD
jgi:colanic acid biosynthesis glycosyl transferase WcaI